MKIKLHFIYTVLLLIVLYALQGCSKNEQPIDEPVFTGLRVKVLSVDSFLLKITADESVLANEIVAPAYDDVPFSVRYLNPRHRFRLFDYYRNTVVADTLITYKLGFINRITFYQAAAGAPMKLMGPPANETPAPAGYGKVSINYTLASLPDSLLVVVENSPNNDGRYEPTDSFVLRKGQFSKFFQARTSANKARANLYTTDPARKLMAQIFAFQFDNMNPDFTNYIFRVSISGGLPANLDGEKLY
jgi:hypothetical protein